MTYVSKMHIETIPIRGTERTVRLICECRIDRDHDYEEWRSRYSPTLVGTPTLVDQRAVHPD